MAEPKKKKEVKEAEPLDPQFPYKFYPFPLGLFGLDRLELTEPKGKE